MKIIHQYKNSTVQKETDEDTGLLLGNDLGDYFYLTGEKETRYQGFFYADGKNYKNEFTVYKIIDRINILNKSKLAEAKNNFFEIERAYNNNLREKYFMPAGHNSLCLEMSRESEAELILDIKHPYDSRSMGRYYDIEMKNNCVLIKFSKYRDWNEDGMGGKKEFSLYLAVKTDQNKHEKIGEFFSKYYEKDHWRNSAPWDRFVYKALKMDFGRAVFSAAKTPREAMEEVEIVFKDFEKLRKKTRDGVYRKLKPLSISDEEIKMAYLCAQNSIHTLMVENNDKKGAYAGLPWFFQFWNRDEAISLLEIQKLNKDLARHIISLQIESISDNGQITGLRFQGMNNEHVESADALGWLADRILKIMQKHQLAKDFKMDIIERFEKSVPKFIKNRTNDDLATNIDHETWMDSLARKGDRIEIQACRLKIYEFLRKSTKNDQYKILEKELKEKTRKKFLMNGVITDSPEDLTVRPNIFLAAYLYPKLLNNQEWEYCFDKALPKLYLDWGGIATIDKNSSEFIPRDAGENSSSYHNGDSWYWINNLTALVLYRLNAHKYSKYINKLMEAGTNEILYGGIAGHHSEISSAEKQTSSGCNAQLWSAAMYLEVFDEILES